MIDLDQSTIEEIKCGYRFEPKTGIYHCLYCGTRYEDGLVYPIDGQYCTASRMIARHVRAAHISPFEQLLKLDKRFIGLTETQKKLLRLIREGKSNQEIATLTGNAASTIRAQRFLFKEKGRQAKLMLAMLEMLQENTENAEGEVKEG